jgi:cellulose biosynthesis protein BcsQ
MSGTRFICFASYKGGVGRSLALANTAYILAREGRKVLIIDFDLEAPGQHQTELFKSNTAGPGLLELINDFRGHFERAPDNEPYSWPLPRFIQRSVAFDDLMMTRSPPRDEADDDTLETQGELWLMRAGELDDGYLNLLHELSWPKFYEQSHGGLFFEALKAKLRQERFDDVLIDARTGLSDVFMIGTLTLADTVVAVTGFQRQHIEGLERVMRLLRAPENEEIYGTKKVFVALSPVADLSPDERRRREDEISQLWPEFPGFDVEIPYYGPLFLRELVVVFSQDLKGLGGPADSVYVSRMMKLRDLLDNSEGESHPKVIEPNNPFCVIRTDYTGPKQWSRYFVDPGNRIVDGAKAFMPCIVYGARGSGKTMLARQFSYETTLQNYRREGRPVEIDHVPYVGLYFRISQDILSIFDTDDVKIRPNFDRLFSQYIDLIILLEALKALNALGGITKWCRGRHVALFNTLFRELGMERPLVLDFGIMIDALNLRLSEIRIYVNNPNSVQVPFAIQPNVLMNLLTEALSENGSIGDGYFIVMLDEYENFRTYQQKILNGRLKHVRRSDRVTYKIFARTEGISTFETMAARQPVQRTRDYRIYFLDEGFDYSVFFEYFSKIAKRRIDNNAYFQNRGISDIEMLFDSWSPDREAEEVTAKRGKDELREWIRKHQPGTADKIEAWFNDEPSALRRATAVVVINQGNNSQEVIDAFRAWDGRARNWYHNYHRGALFWLCRLYRTHKTYAGFSDIVGLSSYNVRTGLEFCFSIIEEWIAEGSMALPIPVSIQTRAIRSKSDEYRKLICSGDSPFANEMLGFADRIGQLFSAIHRGPKQKEPEVNHFHIDGNISDKAGDFLKQCYMGEVLRRIPERKQKDMATEKRDSWQIHPRLAPCYGISWRLKENVVLKAKEVELLCLGSNEEWKFIQNGAVAATEWLGARS